MTKPVFDIAVIGLGAVGGAALLAGARARASVVGFDRFSPPHTLGSTHGETRIVRAAIGEGADYSPFALRSFELLDQLSTETGHTVLDRCGLLVLGAVLPHASHVPAGFLDTTIDAARRYAIPHELLDARTVRERLPAYPSYAGERCVRMRRGRGARPSDNAITLTRSDPANADSHHTSAGRREALQLLEPVEDDTDARDRLRL